LNRSQVGAQIRMVEAQAKNIVDESFSFRILITGTGGQGAIRASQILGWAAVNQGYKVRTAETHGMAQRGGSVVCYLGIGNVNGVLFPRGMADLVLAFEEVEALRNVDYANSNTIFLVSKTQIVPPGLYFKKDARYPLELEIQENLKKVSPHVYFIDAKSIAKRAGEPRAENVVMLAYLYATGKIPIDEDILLRTITSFVPKKALEANKKAFNVALADAKENFAQQFSNKENA
jgi:indolepyruvate ferredoxin oxidoreductase, beta subunit